MEFDFNIIECKLLKQRPDLFMDFSFLKEMDEEPVSVRDYLYVEQKSELWLYLRELAIGTASSLGKLIKGPPQYPTWEQVMDNWRDKILAKKFDLSDSAAAGHMRWGNIHEDSAMAHFAVDNDLSVAQVGTIHLPMSFVRGLCAQYFDNSAVKTLRSFDEFGKHEHFLVSPDGVVCKEKFTNVEQDDERELESYGIVGMLEIKCVSPFHHVLDDDGTLRWCDDMEKRQWNDPRDIPYVYVSQLCLQAIAGLWRLEMTEEDTMWFVRWSPRGFSEFKIRFKELIQMGIVSCILYCKLVDRMCRAQADEIINMKRFSYAQDEIPLVMLLQEAYKNVMRNMEHRYVEHHDLYEHFYDYMEKMSDCSFKKC